MIQQSPTEERARAFTEFAALCERMEQTAEDLAAGGSEADGIRGAAFNLRIAAKALASQAAQPAEADGWVMVPREPTQEMREVATELPIDTGRGHNTALNWEEAAAVWSAMIAATPKAPATDANPYPDIMEWKGQVATPPAPNDDLRAALEARDKKVAECPDKKLDFDKDCPRCGASSNEGCRITVIADAGFVHAARAALKENRRG